MMVSRRHALLLQLAVVNVLVAEWGLSNAQAHNPGYAPEIESSVRCRDTFITSNFNRTNLGNQLSGDVVFAWNVTDEEAAGWWEISTCSENTNFDTYLSLYRDAELTDLVYAEDDWNCSVSTSYSILGSYNALELDPTFNAGVYYIVLEGFANFVGQAELSITCEAVASEVRCGTCGEVQPGVTGCEIPEIEECVCGSSPSCCQAFWHEVCTLLVDACDYTCIDPASCVDEPVVAFAEDFTSCANTESGVECEEEVACIAPYTRFGTMTRPTCFSGSWGTPGCVNPNAGPFGHLWFTTLDSLTFSYHKTGVIRMWESAENDMELQIRTLRPAGVSCDATIIGQVALRAGDQVITAVGSNDAFEVRYNGVLQDNTQNGEVTLGSGADELLLVLSPTVLSISSKRGALIQIFFYLEPGMSWLTAPHMLDPNVFYGNTRGLLGVYDGDGSNDFTTRDGVELPAVPYNGEDHYGEQMEFGNSWVVSESESLFGTAEDAVAAADSQYSANPVGHEAIPCPLEFPNESIADCDSQSPSRRIACYFDVVLGGEQFLQDVGYQETCGNNADQYCSFHGTCVNDACVCNAGWSGEDCSERTCPAECIAGTFTDSAQPCDAATGHCNCLSGFAGPTCEEQADCSAVDDCNALSGNGICVDHNLCECKSRIYKQPDCSLDLELLANGPEGAPPTPTRAPTSDPTAAPTAIPTPTATNPPTAVPTPMPTPIATDAPTPIATDAPTPIATDAPTPIATDAPTPIATDAPTPIATDAPTPIATDAPTPIATDVPTPIATDAPTPIATDAPTPIATDAPTPIATDAPTPIATDAPTPIATDAPTPIATDAPTPIATDAPTPIATDAPTPIATDAPTPIATDAPTPIATDAPTPVVTNAPTPEPTSAPTPKPTSAPTPVPTAEPTLAPTPVPTSALLPGRTSVAQCSSSLVNATTCQVNLYYDTAAVKCCRDASSWLHGPYVECASQQWYTGCFPTALRYEEANEYCSGLIAGGDSDWRLCSAEEIVEECCEESNDIECHEGLNVWSSSTCEGVAPPSDCKCIAEIEVAKPSMVASILSRLNGSVSNLVAAEVWRQTHNY